MFYVTNAKKCHKFVLWGQPKVFRTHFQQKTRKMCEKTPPGGHPAPPDPPKRIFLLEGCVVYVTNAKKRHKFVLCFMQIPHCQGDQNHVRNLQHGPGADPVAQQVHRVHNHPRHQGQPQQSSVPPPGVVEGVPWPENTAHSTWAPLVNPSPGSVEEERHNAWLNINTTITG